MEYLVEDTYTSIAEPIEVFIDKFYDNLDNPEGAETFADAFGDDAVLEFFKSDFTTPAAGDDSDGCETTVAHVVGIDKIRELFQNRWSDSHKKHHRVMRVYENVLGVDFIPDPSELEPSEAEPESAGASPSDEEEDDDESHASTHRKAVLKKALLASHDPLTFLTIYGTVTEESASGAVVYGVWRAQMVLGAKGPGSAEREIRFLQTHVLFGETLRELREKAEDCGLELACCTYFVGRFIGDEGADSWFEVGEEEYEEGFEFDEDEGTLVGEDEEGW